MDMGLGGRPCGEKEAAAAAWHRRVMADYDVRQAVIISKLPDLPLRKDGVVASSIMMKVRDKGYTIPCVACESSGKRNMCCHDEHSKYCEYSTLFHDS